MGVYTYTLRTKTQNVELPGGEIVKANLLGYLCRSNDHDTFMMYPGDYGYRTAMALNAQIEACQQRWWRKGPVFIVQEDAKQGWEIYRAEDAAKAAIWYDCDSMTRTEGVTLIGRLGPRVRRGRKLVWTVMTDEQAQAFDQAEKERHDAEQAEYRRMFEERKAKAERERIEREQREAQEASLNSSGL